MLRLQDFQYDLPESLIAQIPAEPRDSSKLLVVHRMKNAFEHTVFSQITHHLRPGDVLVLNNSKTIPSRTMALRESGKPMEVFFLHPIKKNEDGSEEWEVLSKPGLKISQQVSIDNSSMTVTCLEDLGYTRRVLVKGAKTSVFAELELCGALPIPHYIHESPKDTNRYQTVYAQSIGSSATPTAGLHFTPELLQKIREMGVIIAEVTLHVGLGTFLPIKVNDPTQHTMHAEWYELNEQTARIINEAKAQQRRVIAVGTTSMRTLESSVDPENSHRVRAGSGETSIYIYPPYEFQIVDGLITNFHLPASTLLLLISAFCSQHQPLTTFAESLAGKAYQEAIAHHYRFFSFGDAMFIE